jgi:integrase
MERYVFPRIGSRPVSEVNTADVLEILSPIWHAKAATAREVRQRIGSVLEWAVALDMRSDNPCDRVVPVLGPQNDIVTHRQALPHKDVAAAIETVREGSAQPAVRLAFEFLVLTAARSGEVRLATWDEIDTAGAVWTVPATRMKAKREHRVPLCGRALEILDAVRALGDGSPSARFVVVRVTMGRSRLGRPRAPGRLTRSRGVPGTHAFGDPPANCNLGPA